MGIVNNHIASIFYRIDRTELAHTFECVPNEFSNILQQRKIPDNRDHKASDSVPIDFRLIASNKRRKGLEGGRVCMIRVQCDV